MNHKPCQPWDVSRFFLSFCLSVFVSTGLSLDRGLSVSCRVPTARYTKMGETLRHVIPGHMQCSMACGGRGCKYENPARWRDEEQAIKGLYSSWITDNLLAMARPSTEIIEKYNVLEQFQRFDLRTVINLQRPGEHASCGNSLEQDSGFTYRPETFMEAGIYFYNFGWKDYGVASLTTILDMVKVMSFAIQEGKMAVHCHAGLGRTGVLLACYLVFTSRMSADQAILFVRAKRPNSIQTRGQLLCVREFAQFLVPLRNVFSCAEPRAHAVTLSQYLTRQHHLLHGYEARQLKNVPKIVQLVCKVLLDTAANRQVVEEKMLEVPDLTAELEKMVSQQALQLLGKEMRGKGILVPLPHLAGPHPKTTLTHPETTLTHPETTLTHPETTLTHPETTLTHNGTTPTHPTLTHSETPLNFSQSQLLTHPESPLLGDQQSLTYTLHVAQPLTPKNHALLEPWLHQNLRLSPGHDQPLSSNPELGPLWPRENQIPVSALKSLQPGKRLLSFSDSALYKLQPKQVPDWEQNQDRSWISCLLPHTRLSAEQNLQSPQHPARAWETTRSPHPSPPPPSYPDNQRPQNHSLSGGEQRIDPLQNHSLSGGEQRIDHLQNHSLSGGEQRIDPLQNQNTSPLFQKQRHLDVGQRSRSFGLGFTSQEDRRGRVITALEAEHGTVNRLPASSPKPARTKPLGEELSRGQWDGGMPVKSGTGREKSAYLEQIGVREHREEKERLGDREDKERSKDGVRERRNSVEREDTESRRDLEEVPVVSLHTDGSLKTRHLMVARALTADLKDGNLLGKISEWQRELNSREGAWERLHLERDPVVLAGLMWSWLEQLKEPIISSQDIQALGQNNFNSQHALTCLEKGQRLTLLCILDCAAHLLVLPDQVETDFLNRTIEVFTKIPPKSDQALYQTLTAILTPILHELRGKAEEEMETTNHSF